MLTIGVLGGGNGAFITAADLALKGFNVNLCESPKFESNINLAKRQGGINLEIRANVGLKGGFAKLNKIGTDIKELMTDRNIIFIVVPAFAQKIFAEWGSETFSPEQIIVLEPGNFGGAIEFAEILKDEGIKKLPILVEFECMIYSGFKNDSGSVWVSGYKEGLKTAAYPGKLTDKALAVLSNVYPKLERSSSILETGLSNGNSVLHAPILALNAGWAEQPEMEFLFYWQGCTEAVGRVVEGVENERLALGKALGINLSPIKELLLKYYGHQGAKGETLTEVLRLNPAYEWDYAPKTLQHRFFLEDIPYGMIPMESLGKTLKVPTPLITAIIEIASRLTNKDFRSEGRDLRKLGLQGICKEDLLERVRTGA